MSRGTIDPAESKNIGQGRMKRMQMETASSVGSVGEKQFQF